MRTRFARALLAAVAIVVAVPDAGGAHPVQHGPQEGHLHGSGAWGNLELLSVARLTSTDDLVADVAVSPDGKWAYLANWGEPDCAGPERGGQKSPDAGAWVVDISDLSNPKPAGFIPSHQDTRPGEGMQVVRLTTSAFTGDVLVMNNEKCGKNGKGGVSLFDVSDPRKPMRLSEHFGDRGQADANEIHSAFAWDAGDRAYVVMTDNLEFPDVDILDITNPRRPRKVAEYNVNQYNVAQNELGLVNSFLHDMIVKKIDGRFILLLSYWDGGYVQLDVTDPTAPIFKGQTQFAYPDPELLESTGVALTPEGNAHQAEYTLDNEMFIGTDEDFAPYGATNFRIATGPFQGAYPSVPVPGSAPIVVLADDLLNGPVVYGGYGCPGSAPIPLATQVLAPSAVGPGEEKIIVLQRGPAGDPSATEPACFPGEKAHLAAQAGWDAVLFVQRHGGTENPPLCGSGAFVDEIVGVCTSHEAFHRLFATPPYDAGSWTYPDGPAIGAVGERIEATARFDGWGYVHLFDRQTSVELDTYAINEAHDETYATGFGDLTVHEVATDPQHSRRAYLSYYSGGMRALEIHCTTPGDDTTCRLVEVGGFLDEHGNDFWGVEAFVRDGRTYVLGSDRDSGLWIFKVNG